jgi:hypothetical protein
MRSRFIPKALLGQIGSMAAALSTSRPIPIDPRISAIASGIAAVIPDAQILLFGSRAKGTSRPDSDVDLLITEFEVSQRQQYRSAVTSLAYQEGILLNA